MAWATSNHPAPSVWNVTSTPTLVGMVPSVISRQMMASTTSAAWPRTVAAVNAWPDPPVTVK